MIHRVLWPRAQSKSGRIVRFHPSRDKGPRPDTEEMHLERPGGQTGAAKSVTVTLIIHTHQSIHWKTHTSQGWRIGNRHHN